VVDCSTFSLEGGRFKGLRQAVNRVARHGYHVEFFDPARLPRDHEAALLSLASSGRRGPAERGFSMTLGRLFDPDDRGLLLAVAFDPHRAPVAFCQFVPAAGINGYSLDVMRRDRGDHPNGVLDFVIVETIHHLADRGCTGLALNFATARGVISGELGDTFSLRTQRKMWRWLSESMQIESLWRYNAKFAPGWKPRYALYDARAHLLPAAVAVARAEAFTEVPVIGRLVAAGTRRNPRPSGHPNPRTS